LEQYERDAYVRFIEEMTSEELSLELDTAFIQMNDLDEAIRYNICLSEMERRNGRIGS